MDLGASATFFFPLNSRQRAYITKCLHHCMGGTDLSRLQKSELLILLQGITTLGDLESLTSEIFYTV